MRLIVCLFTRMKLNLFSSLQLTFVCVLSCACVYMNYSTWVLRSPKNNSLLSGNLEFELKENFSVLFFFEINSTLFYLINNKINQNIMTFSHFLCQKKMERGLKNSLFIDLLFVEFEIKKENSHIFESSEKRKWDKFILRFLRFVKYSEALKIF